MSKSTIATDAMETITSRLSLMDDLYFPRKVQPSAAASSSHRKTLLLDLLSRDAAVFLERYGSKLSLDELTQFDPLRDDYEINWHLNNLRRVIDPTEEEKRVETAKVKNRRLAYMDRLVLEGEYFSEDAMREREPYLHHEYVGKFQDLSGRRMARPGERWSETLIRRCEEADLVGRIREEQMRLGVAERDWVGNEVKEEEEETEEEESDTEDEEEEEVKEKEDEEEKERERLGPEEMRERMDQFTYVMQQKFLGGEDKEHVDYVKIDEDETLDDYWMREANQDAEEKYFDDV